MKEIKRIDLGESVYALCKAHPEMKEILLGLGFADITKAGMLQTAGRIMTIPKGARMKGMRMNAILEKLREHGFIPKEDGTYESGNQ